MAKETDVSCPKKSSAKKSNSCLDTDSNNTKSVDWTNVIDPQLWLDDSMLDAMNVDDNELNGFEDQLFSTVLDGPAAVETTTSSDLGSNRLGESDEELNIFSIFAESETLLNIDGVKSTEHGQQYQSPQGFIAMYAAIDTVCRESFAKLWPNFAAKKVFFEDSTGQFATRGHSRDEPSPMIFRCQVTVGCPYTSVRKHPVVIHETTCTAVLVAKTVEKKKSLQVSHAPKKIVARCSEPAASSTTIIGVHIDSYRLHAAKGATPHKIYTTYAKYQAHMNLYHCGRFPATCQYPGYLEKLEYKTLEKYSEHLRETHDINNKHQRKQHLPPRIPAPKPDKPMLSKHKMQSNTMNNSDLKELALKKGKFPLNR